MFTSTIRKGGQCDLGDFDCGMIVDTRQTGLSISITADLLGISFTTVVFTQKDAILKKHPVSDSIVDRNTFMMRQVNGYSNPHKH